MLAIQQAVATKSAVVQSCLRLPLENKEVTLSNIKLGESLMPCRLLVLAGWLRCEPAATALDLRDFSMTEAEAEMISTLIRKLPKVVCLNVLHNETMGSTGASHLSKCLSEGGGGALKSLCGIQPHVASLEVPRKDLQPVDSLIFAAELENSQWAESTANEQNASKKFSRLHKKGRVDGTNSWYPLIWAARDGNNELVSAMLDRGMNVDMKEQDKHDAGFTPLMCAAIKGHAKTVELLLERGAATELLVSTSEY